MSITYQPNDKYLFSSEYDDIAIKLGSLIFNTFHISYSEDNPAKKAIESDDYIDMKTLRLQLQNTKPAN